jgi:tetratricopeptide (TPR) repeat protein
LLRPRRCTNKFWQGSPRTPTPFTFLAFSDTRKVSTLQAVELIGRAIALRSSIPAFHSDLAEAYRSLGQHEQAVDCCREALRLLPEYPEAQNNLGLALQRLGRHGEAVEHFRSAFEKRPGFAAAHNNLGISLRELTQLDLALAEFRVAVELEPDFAPARTNLGQMLLERGAVDEALFHCQEAARLQPDLAVLHHNLGSVLRDLKRPVEARAAYQNALRIDPNFAQAQACLGMLLCQEGQLRDALGWLTRAVETEPENPEFWESLAELHGDLEEPEQAIACWEKALIRQPERASAHRGLGWSLQEEGRIGEAGEHFRTAMQLQPGAPANLFYLGGMHEEMGELVEAEACFREALRLNPSYPQARARLATLLRGKLPDVDLVALESRLADAKLDEPARASLLFAQAHVLDARGDFAGAAGCLSQANALALSNLRRRQRGYLPSDHDRFVDGMVRNFGPDFFRQAIGAGVDARQPVFVFGLPRSGTTLVEQILASHPRVHGAGELRVVRQLFESIPAQMRAWAWPTNGVPTLNVPIIRQLAERYLELVRCHATGQAERIVDKMPDNYLYLGLIAAMFPNATLIHCRRDLRDVAVSCWMTDFRTIRWANDVDHIARRFAQYRRLMTHWHTVLPERLHEIDYEETVSDLEGVARRLTAACGLEWDPACLRFYETQRPVRTASVMQVRQPIYMKSVARWKNYEVHLADLFGCLAE